ncbi:MAG: LPXTG cell wall anchor domain-containing protein [Acidimicrobiia bacterium]
MRRIVTLLMLAASLSLGALVATAGAQTTEPTYAPEVGGTVVTRDPGIRVRGASAKRLATTGSDGTSTYVLVGLAVVGIGGVLVVAGRRPKAVLHRI